MVAPPAHSPQTVNAVPSALHPPQEHKPSWRSDRTSSSGSSISKPGVSLSDSSSSPVEPIKPLLDLSLGDTSGSLTVPLHPVFDEAAPYNVSAMTGNTAYLHCLVHNLGNKSVSVASCVFNLCWCFSLTEISDRPFSSSSTTWWRPLSLLSICGLVENVHSFVSTVCLNRWILSFLAGKSSHDPLL